MASPPLTTREYAYLSITGPGSHEKITEILGLDPSQAWNPGDRSDQTGRLQKYMRWRRDSGFDDREPLERHIESLLTLLAAKEEQLRQLWLEYDLTLQCVGYYPPSGHGAHLSRELVRQAARLGLALDLDFCSGQLIPDTTLSFSSATAGAIPSLNWWGRSQL